jgi:hypothetical protein
MHSECFPPDTIRETITNTVRDTITYIEENESTLEAYFICDSNNQVLMKQLSQTNTGVIKPTVVFRDNVLRLRYFTDSIAVLHKIIERTQAKEVYVKNPVNIQMQKDLQKSDKKLKRWRKIGIGGIITMLLLAVFAAYKIFK